jgi:hypothetical protein
MREIDRYGHDLTEEKFVFRRKTYDLRTAHPILKAWVVGFCSGGSETLYKTPEGHYFIVVKLGMGLKPKLVPRSLAAARQWLEKIQKPPLVLDLQ